MKGGAAVLCVNWLNLLDYHIGLFMNRRDTESRHMLMYQPDIVVYEACVGGWLFILESCEYCTASWHYSYIRYTRLHQCNYRRRGVPNKILSGCGLMLGWVDIL